MLKQCLKLCLLLLLLGLLPKIAQAQEGRRFGARLISYEEVPTLSNVGEGTFNMLIDSSDTSFDFELTCGYLRNRCDSVSYSLRTEGSKWRRYCLLLHQPGQWPSRDSCLPRQRYGHRNNHRSQCHRTCWARNQCGRIRRSIESHSRGLCIRERALGSLPRRRDQGPALAGCQASTVSITIPNHSPESSPLNRAALPKHFRGSGSVPRCWLTCLSGEKPGSSR